MARPQTVIPTGTRFGKRVVEGPGVGVVRRDVRCTGGYRLDATSMLRCDCGDLSEEANSTLGPYGQCFICYVESKYGIRAGNVDHARRINKSEAALKGFYGHDWRKHQQAAISRMEAAEVKQPCWDGCVTQ